MTRTLQQKNTRYLLIWLPLVLLLGTVVFYIMLTMHSHHMQEEQLGLKQQNVWKTFKAKPASVALQIPGEYSIDEGTGIPEKLRDKPRDTALQYNDNVEKINFKILTKQYSWNNKSYQLTTYVSSKEFFHLIVKVFATEAFIFLLLLLSIGVINRKSSRILWKPFYNTMKKTAAYDVVRNPAFELPKETGISEFNQLNNELNSLVEKINAAYSNQKQFVENASHEIQTPLAIIRSKLDLFINEPGLTEKTAALLADITEANDRLSQMNKSLLLLAKIDNNQFPEQARINISALLEKILFNYQEHYDSFPALTKSIQPGVHITANAALAEILFTNLVKNAVIHNIRDGYISISLNSNQFTIENSGEALSENPELLFERFKKGNNASKTTGLGLALVKQIADLYNMNLKYNYQNSIHQVSIIF